MTRLVGWFALALHASALGGSAGGARVRSRHVALRTAKTFMPRGFVLAEDRIARDCEVVQRR